MTGVDTGCTKFSAQKRCICPGGTEGIRDKEIEDKGEGKGTGRGRRGICPEDKGLPLNRGKTDVAHRQIAVNEGKRGTPC